MSDERRILRIPRRMRKLPIEKRGYPVPFATMIDPITGQPDFRILDIRRQMQCFKDKLCAMCGEPLGRYIAFIGGPKSGESHRFNDPGMHRECAEYAAVVCPYISRETAQHRSISDLDLATLKSLGLEIVTDSGITEDRDAPEMYLYIALGYTLLPAQFGLHAVANEFVETVQIKQSRSVWRPA